MAFRTCWILLLLVLCLPMGALSEEPEPRTDPEIGPDPEFLCEVGALPWLERFRWKTGLWLQGPVDRLDALFVREQDKALQVPHSTFRFRLRGQGAEQEDGELDIEGAPDIRVDLEIPNIEHQLNLFLERTRDAARWGGESEVEVDLAPEERELRLGLQFLLRPIRKVGIRFDAGIESHWPPEAFGLAQLSLGFGNRRWRVRPRQTFSYWTDEGFGETSELRAERWFGERVVGMLDSQVHWTEQTQGVELRQSAVIGVTLVGDRDNPCSVIGLQGTAFGHKDSSGLVDRYQVSVPFRMPVYRDWVVLRFTPKLDFENEQDWEPTPSVRVELEMLVIGVR